jgi:hypothetical protein
MVPYPYDEDDEDELEGFHGLLLLHMARINSSSCSMLHRLSEVQSNARLNTIETFQASSSPGVPFLRP